MSSNVSFSQNFHCDFFHNFFLLYFLSRKTVKLCDYDIYENEMVVYLPILGSSIQNSNLSFHFSTEFSSLFNSKYVEITKFTPIFSLYLHYLNRVLALVVVVIQKKKEISILFRSILARTKNK